MLMAAARLNLASVFVYNGSTMPGVYKGNNIDITTVFEAVGACAAGTMTEAELTDIEKAACPGEGACGGMFTANTMSSIAEALGMSLPGTASAPAIDPSREGDAQRAGAAVVNMLRLGIRPRDIMTKKAFENAIAVTNAFGASSCNRKRSRCCARPRRLQQNCRQSPTHRRYKTRWKVSHV
jgi:dihydroxy-acid dehydratase